jgi:hypothetical protein
MGKKTKVIDAKQAERDACIIHIKKEMNEKCSEEFQNTMVDIFQKDGLIKFIILQFPSDNCQMLEILFEMFKTSKYIKKLLNRNMANLLLASIPYPHCYLEMCKWYSVCGYDPELMNENIMALLYLSGINNPEIKPYIHKIYKTMNMKDYVINRIMYYVHDDADIIVPYINKDKILKSKVTESRVANPIRVEMNKIILRCFQYDAINTLMKIQKELKLPFYNVTWFMLGVMGFEKVCEINKINPYDNELFIIDWIENVCIMSKWDYLPIMIPKLTENMWKVVTIHFYKGAYEVHFVITLLHLMKKYDIPITKLVDKKYVFNNKSPYINYLKLNNLYELFSTDNSKEKLIKLADTPVYSNVLETTLTSVTTLFGIFNDKSTDTMASLLFEGGMYMSSKFVQELEYIDSLIYDDLLGWNETIIKSYENFKKICNIIIEDGKVSQVLTTTYNSFYVLETTERFPELYNLRYINNILSIYNRFNSKIYKENFKIIYDKCIEIKFDILKIVRPLYKSKMKDDELFVLPSERAIKEGDELLHNNIYDHFEDLIENYDKLEDSDKKQEQFFIDMLKDDKKIQGNVRFLFNNCYIPLSPVIRVLYNYWGYYAKEECYFLE